VTVDLAAIDGLRLTRRQTLTPRDVMLYALGVGLGADPLDEQQLRYVHEDGLKALPTLAITLTYPPLLAAYEAAGIVPHRVLQAHRPLACAGWRRLPHRRCRAQRGRARQRIRCHFMNNTEHP
jgi:hypothetical protein